MQNKDIAIDLMKMFPPHKNMPYENVNDLKDNKQSQ